MLGQRLMNFLIIRPDGGNRRLLQHNLGKPYMVRIRPAVLAKPATWQNTAVLVVPRQKRRRLGAVPEAFDF